MCTHLLTCQARSQKMESMRRRRSTLVLPKWQLDQAWSQAAARKHGKSHTDKGCKDAFGKRDSESKKAQETAGIRTEKRRSVVGRGTEVGFSMTRRRSTVRFHTLDGLEEKNSAGSSVVRHQRNDSRRLSVVRAEREMTVNSPPGSQSVLKAGYRVRQIQQKVALDIWAANHRKNRPAVGRNDNASLISLRLENADSTVCALTMIKCVLPVCACQAWERIRQCDCKKKLCG